MDFSIVETPGIILSKRLLIVLRKRVILACEHALFSEGEEAILPIEHPRFDFLLVEIGETHQP